MRTFKDSDIKRLFSEYKALSGNDNFYEFYKWADDMEGPVIPEDRNLNPAIWINRIIKSE